MIKRLLPLILVTMCALPTAQSSTGASTATPRGDAPVCVAEASALDTTALSTQERRALQLAQQSADPQLGEQRGGIIGLLIVVLLIVLIVVLVD
jgi:hypothetical protein